jgi:hypothetical protein
VGGLVGAVSIRQQYGVGEIIRRYKKLGMDCPVNFRLCAGEEAQMEQETVELVRRLCCEAGMIMEDMNPLALMTPRDPAELGAVVEQLSKAIGRMRAIVEAARAIL